MPREVLVLARKKKKKVASYFTYSVSDFPFLLRRSRLKIRPMATCVPKRSLILTLDAFGTLIKPRKPISIQYREEAEKFGLPILSQKEAELEFSFKKGGLFIVLVRSLHISLHCPYARRLLHFRIQVNISQRAFD